LGQLSFTTQGEALVPFTPDAISEFISARAIAVTECNAQDLSEEFPTAPDWVTGFGLMVIFNDKPKLAFRPFALQLIRRCEMALANYGHARRSLQDLIAGDRRRWSPYYRALSYFEAAVAQLYQAYVHMHKLLGTPLFAKNDGSPLQRLNHIYNASKHETPSEADTVWITNAGLETKGVAISFAEIEELMRVCGRISNRLTSTG
jgi:hypothetical protein